MTGGWTGRSSRKAQLTPEVRALAKGFTLQKGTLVMPRNTFITWRRAHQELSGQARHRCLTELLAVLLRFQKVGASTREAQAQLMVLAADLMRSPSKRPRLG